MKCVIKLTDYIKNISLRKVMRTCKEDMARIYNKVEIGRMRKKNGGEIRLILIKKYWRKMDFFQNVIFTYGSNETVELDIHDTISYGMKPRKRRMVGWNDL